VLRLEGSFLFLH
jgi:hypothetical protein